MSKLTSQQIEHELHALAAWQAAANALTKTFRFDRFTEGIDFVNRVAELAERADHHPDISINYTRVAFSLTTHSEGGVTEKDVRLAQAIDQAYQEWEASQIKPL